MKDPLNGPGGRFSDWIRQCNEATNSCVQVRGSANTTGRVCVCTCALDVSGRAQLPLILPARRRHFAAGGPALRSGILEALLGTSRASAAADRPNALPEENENVFLPRHEKLRGFFLPCIFEQEGFRRR